MNGKALPGIMNRSPAGRFACRIESAGDPRNGDVIYLGGRWYTFDPRNNAPRIGRVLIARVRDAADVPLTHSVWAEEAPLGSNPAARPCGHVPGREQMPAIKAHESRPRSRSQHC